MLKGEPYVWIDLPFFVTEISSKTKPGNTIPIACKTTVSKLESTNLAKPLRFYLSLFPFWKLLDMSIIKQKLKTAFKTKII